MNNPSEQRTRRGLVAVICAGVLALGAGIATNVLLTRVGPAPTVSGLVFPEPRALPEFTLQDQRGLRFGLAQLRGHWSVFAYGYTHCPDICPTTLASLAKAARRIKEREPDAAKLLQYVFLTVDPERDTPARLAEYLPFFHPDFIGVRAAAPAEAQSLEQALGMVAIINKPEDPDKPEQYSVDHGVAMYLVDPDGRLRALLRPEGAGAMSGSYDTDRLTGDILAVMAHYSM